MIKEVSCISAAAGLTYGHDQGGEGTLQGSLRGGTPQGTFLQLLTILRTILTEKAVALSFTFIEML